MKKTTPATTLQPHRTTLCRVVFFVMLLIGANARAQITVTGGQPAAILAQKLVGQGVTVLNPQLRCQTPANGLFTVLSANLGLDSGIVLTTGRAATTLGLYGVDGPSDALASYDYGAPGDSELTVLAGQTTKDACSLEFDVIPAGDTVSVDYVFGSEEYISAVCGPYNDAFAFFISGPGITGADNMALVPGSNIPVTINSINNGIPGSTGHLSNCTDMGAGSPFTAYYVDNTMGTKLTYRGFTTVLKAQHVVHSCSTYHFKIVIADAGNGKYDSGVFLKAGSLKTGDYRVQALTTPVYDSLAPICVKGCQPGRFRIKNSKPLAQPQVVHYTTSGTAVSGVDYGPLPDSVTIPPSATFADVVVYGLPTPINGSKTLKLTIYAPAACNNSTYIADSATLTIYDTLHLIAHPADTTVCGGDSIHMHLSGDDIYTYTWSPVIAISNNNIKEPTLYPSASTSYTVTASLPGTLCPFGTATINVSVRSTATVDLVGDTLVCYNTPFVLAPQVIPANPFYSYHWVGPDGYSSTTLSASINAGAAGLYQLVVTNDTNGCKGNGSININLFTPPSPLATSPAYYCVNGQPIGLSAQGSNLHWYAPDGGVVTIAPVPPLNDIANYNYYVSDITNNCESPRAEVQVHVEKCCDGHITIPTAFTPNGDGLNDLFRPLEDFSYSLKNISIYNRWGQVIYSGNISGWNGNFGTEPAAAGVYYYIMTFDCILGGTIQKTGDITLIR